MNGLERRASLDCPFWISLLKSNSQFFEAEEHEHESICEYFVERKFDGAENCLESTRRQSVSNLVLLSSFIIDTRFVFHKILKEFEKELSIFAFSGILFKL